jgi:hypothetical protein
VVLVDCIQLCPRIHQNPGNFTRCGAMQYGLAVASSLANNIGRRFDDRLAGES